MDFDCCKCGACCLVGEQEGYYFDGERGGVPLTEEDKNILEDHGHKHIIIEGNYFFPYFLKDIQYDEQKQCEGGVTGFGCIAFSGQPGVSCQCTIYDIRPKWCRTGGLPPGYPPGNPDCLVRRKNLKYLRQFKF